MVSACIGSPIGSPELIAFAKYPNCENKTHDVGGQGAQLVVPGLACSMADTRPLDDAEAAAHLGEPEGSLINAQLLHSGGDGGLSAGSG